MVKTRGDYYYNTKTGLPMKTSMFVLLLNFILQLMYKMAKAVYSAVKRMFPAGIDGKTVIKK